VAAVHDFGAGDILELQPKAGGTSIMVPFTAAFVPSVDIANGRIVVASLEDAPGNRGAAAKSGH
jgi:16S rRNA processing protein RimM